eukprot:3291029-Pleurochrysis_carterae.AAC.1
MDLNASAHKGYGCQCSNGSESTTDALPTCATICHPSSSLRSACAIPGPAPSRVGWRPCAGMARARPCWHGAGPDPLQRLSSKRGNLHMQLLMRWPCSTRSKHFNGVYGMTLAVQLAAFSTTAEGKGKHVAKSVEVGQRRRLGQVRKQRNGLGKSNRNKEGAPKRQRSRLTPRSEADSGKARMAET